MQHHVSSVISPQSRKTVQFLTSKTFLSLFLVSCVATYSDMVSKSNERWHCLGRRDSDGEHLSVKSVVISIKNSEMEDVHNGLIAGLKHGGVAVKVRTQSASGSLTDSQANTPHPCI